MRNRINLRAMWKSVSRRFTREALKHLLVRTYALFILALVVMAGYLAVHYLVVTVFYPPQVPKQILDWAGRLDVAALHTKATAGVEVAAPRSPISHYHQVDAWFQPDGENGCTVNGCHEPLPHGAKAKVPAFANFHTTFLTCEMCHASGEQRPAQVRWVNIATGAPQESPAILQLMSYLELSGATIEQQPTTAHTEITGLLRQTIATLGQDAALDQLLAEMETSEPGSPVWKQAVSDLTAELPLHARGEYRAKIARAGEDRSALFQSLTEQARQYLNGPQNPDFLKPIHAGLAKEPAKCLACHDDNPGMLDFAAAGYSPKRSKYLSSLAVARLMQQIREGQSFYLPNLQGSVP